MWDFVFYSFGFLNYFNCQILYYIMYTIKEEKNRLKLKIIVSNIKNNNKT